MSGAELKGNDVKALPGIKPRSVLSSLRVLPVLATLVAVCVAAALGYQAWQYYMGAPWTRDGTVRAYVVKIAPQVGGEIVQLPVADNQFVHRGDLLMLIDPRNYSIAVRQAKAAVEQTKAVAANANAEMIRRLKLNDIAVTQEERQTYISQAATAEASYQSALANLAQARINYQRTSVRSPVNGFVTNLSAQLGDYADVGALQLSVVNSDSYWIDAYFEETALGRIEEGDAATIKLMGYTPLLRGRVEGLARGIDVPNAAPDASGLASVNPIFTFVRLAQRVPVRIRIDEVPDGVKLVAGLTATVQVEPFKAPPLTAPKAAPGPAATAEPKPGPTDVVVRAQPQQQASQTHELAAWPKAAPQTSSPPAPAAAKPQAGAPAARAPAPGDGGLAVPLPPSPNADAAEAAAAADLKTLQEQIAANPPSGAPSPATPAGPGQESVADAMTPNQYLGQTFDLEGGQSVTPSPGSGSPDSIRRRARSKWRRTYDRQ
jgi:multidrug resistance efflux pump